MSDEIEAKVSYTSEDFVRNVRYMQSRQGLMGYPFLLAIVVVICILLFFYILNPVQFIQTFSQPKNYLVFVIAFLIAGAWWILKKMTSGFLLKRKFENQLKSTPSLSEPQFISFDDEGMFATNQFGSGQTKWLAMVEAAETENDFFFFTSKKFAQFVPKRFFSEEQINQIRKLAKSNLGEKAKF